MHSLSTTALPGWMASERPGFDFLACLDGTSYKPFKLLVLIYSCVERALLHWFGGPQG